MTKEPQPLPLAPPALIGPPVIGPRLVQRAAAGFLLLHLLALPGSAWSAKSLGCTDAVRPAPTGGEKPPSPVPPPPRPTEALVPPLRVHLWLLAGAAWDSLRQRLHRGAP